MLLNRKGNEMSIDYFNDGEYAEFQNVVSKESIKLNSENIKCETNSMFIFFINWLSGEEGWSGSEICCVVERPHAYKKEYKKFLKYWRTF